MVVVTVLCVWLGFKVNATIVDVVGSIDPLYATHDSLGNIVIDPWPTAFASGGFDLDGMGVIHQSARVECITERRLWVIYDHSALARATSAALRVACKLSTTSSSVLASLESKAGGGGNSAMTSTAAG